MGLAAIWLAFPALAFQQSVRSESDDLGYTLVQYRGIGCASETKMCQNLTKGSCTVTTARQGAVDFKVYTDLIDEGDGKFMVKACERSGCDCTYNTTWTPSLCEAKGSISYMLVPGPVEGCVTTSFDVAGGRHHDQYASAMEPTIPKTADDVDGEKADGEALVQRFTQAFAPS